MVDQEEVRTKLDQQLDMAAAQVQARMSQGVVESDKEAQIQLMKMMPPAQKRKEKK